MDVPAQGRSHRDQDAATKPKGADMNSARATELLDSNRSHNTIVPSDIENTGNSAAPSSTASSAGHNRNVQWSRFGGTNNSCRAHTTINQSKKLQSLSLNSPVQMFCTNNANIPTESSANKLTTLVTREGDISREALTSMHCDNANLTNGVDKKILQTSENPGTVQDDSEDSSEYTWTDCSDEEEETNENAVLFSSQKAKSIHDKCLKCNKIATTGRSESSGTNLNIEVKNSGNINVANSAKNMETMSSFTAQTTILPALSRIINYRSSSSNMHQKLKRSNFKTASCSSKCDLSWVENRTDNQMMDSMYQMLHKAVESTMKWSSDPLEGLKGKKTSSVLVGTYQTDPYPRPIREVEPYTYEGETDFYGRPHGRGVATFRNGDRIIGDFRDGMREGKCTLQLAPDSGKGREILYLDTMYIRDRLEGKGKVEYRNGDVLHSWFSSGTVHGLGKLFNKNHRLKHVGWYSNGKLSGVVWNFCEGGGCLLGKVNAATGLMKGENIAFLFTDRQTALVGTFIKGRMSMANTCFIQSVVMRNEIGQLRFTQPCGPIYEFDPGMTEHISLEPLLPDPYEVQYVKVHPSKIRGAQEGLFA